MKYLLALYIFFGGCNISSDNLNQQFSHSEISEKDTTNLTKKFVENNKNTFKDSTYSNKVFRNVVVSETGNGYFEINGEANVFEATFYYFLRQNKKESDVEFVTVNTLSSEWGKFNFNFNTNFYKKDIPLYLVIFESSAKDGSRVNELIIKLF